MNSMFAIFTNAVYNNLQIYLNFLKYIFTDTLIQCAASNKASARDA